MISCKKRIAIFMPLKVNAKILRTLELEILEVVLY